MDDAEPFLPDRGDLPIQLTRFFGREAETADLVRLLGTERLVTVVGAPGCGKTRLVIEVAGQVAARFAGGVRFVELAPLAESGSVASAVGSVLGVSEQPGRPMIEVLVEALGAADPVLLLLDNCEHVIDASAALVRRLVTACPLVRVLTTSRTPLGLPGERTWGVPRFDVQAAVSLFVDRAPSLSGNSTFAPADKTSIEAICIRLDCLPLAIELTAAWSRVLSPSQILAGLAGPLPQLTIAGRSRGSRHDTMAVAVDWSYRLLPPDAQLLFQQVSVFAGTFDLDALNAVAPSESDLLASLCMLVDHSLVLAERTPAGLMRYRVLEPVRQYAESLLAASGESDKARERHFHYYVGLAHRYDPWGLWTKDQPVPLERLVQEDANLVAAFEWARRQPSDLGLQAAVALTMYWAYGGRVNDGCRWLEDILAKRTPDRRLRAGALAGAGLMAWRHGDYEKARSQLQEALRLTSSFDDPPFYARTLLRLAPVEFSAGRLEQAAELCQEAIDVYGAMGKQVGATSAPVVLGVSTAMMLLGWIRYVEGNTDAGREQMCAALEANRPFGNTSLTAYGNLGLAYGAMLAEHREAQRTHLAAAVTAMNEGGIVERSDWLWLSVCLASAEERYPAALRLLGGADASSQSRGSRPPIRSSTIASLIERPFNEVSPALAGRLVAHGRQMDWDRLVEEALAEPKPELAPLTPREYEIAELIAEGVSNIHVAERLHISRRTVESHIDHIKQKLGLNRRNEIIVWMLQESPRSHRG